MLSIIKKLMRESGLALISYSFLFSPILASAEGINTGAVVLGFPVGAVVTGVVLVSMSKTKTKATKADKYVRGRLQVHQANDDYIRTETSRVKINHGNNHR